MTPREAREAICAKLSDIAGTKEVPFICICGRGVVADCHHLSGREERVIHALLSVMEAFGDEISLKDKE